MNLEELKKVIEEKGMDWLIAAMVEGSIGYHSPSHAKRLIENALSGETKDYCERCMACYKCDLLKMIEFDIMDMKYIEEHVPAKFQRIVEAVKAITGLSANDQAIVGLMYPTRGI